MKAGRGNNTDIIDRAGQSFLFGNLGLTKVKNQKNIVFWVYPFILLL
jgi:hypothetical protein